MADFFLVTPVAAVERSNVLRDLVDRVRDDTESQKIGECAAFRAPTGMFQNLPEAALAYWVQPEAARLFRRRDTIEPSLAEVQRGAFTGDNFRFLRMWWEVNPIGLGYTVRETQSSVKWLHYARGGRAAPYYGDVFTVVNWSHDAEEIQARALDTYSYVSGDAEWVLHRDNAYCEAGITFPRRSSRLYCSCLPSGCIFSHGGQAVFPRPDISIAAVMAYMASEPFFELLSVQLPVVDVNPQYEVGQIRRTPALSAGEIEELDASGDRLIRLARERFKYDETSHQFAAPELLAARREGGADALALEAAVLSRQERDRSAQQVSHRIDEKVRRLLELEQSQAVNFLEIRGAEGPAYVREAEEGGGVDRSAAVANLLMWCVGVAFGRWDVRMARDEELIPDLQGPFERLPRVARGGLVGADGLPATRDAIASEAWLKARPDVITEPEPGSWDGPASVTAEEYPVEVAWDGILVDDPDHEKDIVRRVRRVLRYVYGREGAREIEEAALEILRADGRTPRSLRDWFRNSKATELGHSFFDFHIRRYSKSRRKAPIYWRLCSSPARGKSSYGVWLYSHRLSEDTLWTALNEYVRPKIGVVERRKREAREGLEGAEGREARRLERELEEADELLEELAWFEEELTKVAEEDWTPELDDGVVINLAPLRELVPWKEPEKHWTRLEKGEYDWSRTAMRYWPERVREKCREDKSLAMAHDLEEIYQGG